MLLKNLLLMPWVLFTSWVMFAARVMFAPFALLTPLILFAPGVMFVLKGDGHAKHNALLLLAHSQVVRTLTGQQG